MENKRKRKRGEDTAQSKPKDVGDILKVYRIAKWQESDADEDHPDDDYTTMNCVVSNRSYEMEDIIYMEEVLKDPAIETFERFNIATIKQNQQTFTHH